MAGVGPSILICWHCFENIIIGNLWYEGITLCKHLISLEVIFK